MHSYQPSRGRIFFQVLCAFGISAALAGSWMQTGATALAAAASIAALYGLVHFFDMFQQRPVIEVVPQRIDFDHSPETESVQLAQVSSAPSVSLDPAPVVDIIGIEELPTVEAEPFEPDLPSAKEGRVGKAPRKGGSRRKKAPQKEEVAVFAPAAEAGRELPSPSEPEFPDSALAPPEPLPHSTVTPLFEPEPFGRPPPRATFGRKVG